MRINLSDIILYVVAAVALLLPVGVVGVYVWVSSEFHEVLRLSDYQEGLNRVFFLFDDGLSVWDIPFVLLCLLLATAFFLPLSITAAVVINEYGSRQSRRFLHVFVLTFAAVPVSLYAFGVVIFLERTIGVYLNDLFYTAFVCAIMCVPIGVSLSNNALRQVSKSLKNAAYMLGATRIQTAKQVIIPSATPRLIRNALFGIGRVLSEIILVGTTLGYLKDVGTAAALTLGLAFVLYILGVLMRKI